MTKEELEKEAEEYALNQWEGNIPWGVIQKAYFDSAEPREKQIAELERKLKVETELSNRLGLAYREYEELTKEQDEHLAKLEKENAELKAKIEKQNADILFLKHLTEELEKENAEFKEQLYAFDEEREKLRKENAELKQEAKDLYRECDENCENRDDCSLWLWKIKTDQLTKAKKIIKEMLRILPKENIEGIYEITDEAEQFISEVKK